MKFKNIFNHKFLLNSCNLVFLLCGSVLVFCGFYLFSDTERILLSRLIASTSERLLELPHPLFYYIALGLAVSGTVAILSAIVGFWASCLNTYCFLTLYFLTVVVLLLAESAVCLAITIWPQCLGLNLDESKMVKSLQGRYGVPGHEQFTVAMDMVQTKFHCCGMNSDINYDTAMWRLQGYGQREWAVPLTCCSLENEGESQSYLDPKPVDVTQCQNLQRFEFEGARHTEPCLDYLSLWYREQYVLFLAASLVIAIVEFCVLLSIILNCSKISSKKVEKRLQRMETTDRRTLKNPVVQNIYHPDITLSNGMPNLIPSDIKEVYIQPPELHKNRHNTTFKPSKNQYHLARSYLV